MSNVILDSSALIALIRNEPGAEIVENLLGNIIMSSVNIAETAAILLAPEMTQEECELLIAPFISSTIQFNTQQAYITASLRSQTKHLGISLGDRACLALGILKNYPVYTADKIWSELNIPGLNIILIR